LDGDCGILSEVQTGSHMISIMVGSRCTLTYQLTVETSSSVVSIMVGSRSTFSHTN